jgi:gluconokinase
LGVGDGACANLGSKCSSSRRIAVTVGTSAAARICLQQSIGSSTNLTVPPGLFCYRVDRCHVLVGGALTDGGSVVEWATQLLNLTTPEAFERCVAQAQALAQADYDSHSTTNQNPIMIPFLSGERSTGYRDGATGALSGLTRDTTPAHILRACLEGVALRLRAILLLILEARRGNTEDDEPMVVVSGKALEVNELWRQMLADSSGLKVVLDMDTHEGTSRGVALLAAAALAATNANNKDTSKYILEEDIKSFKASGPRPNAQNYFNQAAQSQDAFLEAMSPLYTSK